MKKLLLTSFFFLVFMTSSYATLENYINKNLFKTTWKILSSTSTKDIKSIDVLLTSQLWQGITWQHYIEIFIPIKNKSNLATILITTKKGMSQWHLPNDAVKLAKETGSTIIVLYNIPNQPLFDELIEDELIAYSFTQYLETGYNDWPLLFPMSKATIKAMDAVQEIVHKTAKIKIERFILTGASKRGWLTWLVAASDDRVVGIIPLVFDNLRFAPQMNHQLKNWGKISEQLSDYTDYGLINLINTEQGQKLISMIDPYFYLSKYQNVQKLLVHGTNDRYWVIDAAKFYWNDLPGTKNILYLPNKGHRLARDKKIFQLMKTFLKRNIANYKLPQINWEFKETNSTLTLNLTSLEKPHKIKIWYAKSNIRDFRNAKWRSKKFVLRQSEFTYSFNKPKKQYLALFAEIIYKTKSENFSLSTTIKVTKNSETVSFEHNN